MKTKSLLFVGLLLLFSCKKEKLNDNAIRLEADWEQRWSCKETGCAQVTNGDRLIIRAKGIITLQDNQKKTKEKGKFTRVEQVSDPTTFGYDYYLFRVSIEKRAGFGKVEVLRKYNYIQYTSVMEADGSMVQQISLMQSMTPNQPGDQVFQYIDVPE